jgi:hypothetical protein
MIRSWISLAILFVVVVALGLWVAYRPKTAEREAHALSTLRANDVSRIHLERWAPNEAADTRKANDDKSQAVVSVALERRADGWRMTQPVSARADTFNVTRLLAVLDAQSVARYAAKDLARYGLDRPIAKLTLNDETFSFGAVNTMTREQYVLAGDAVYAIPLAQRTTLPRDAASLISRALFAPGESPVRFEFQDFTAVLQNEKWTFNPVAEEPGPDERNAWISAWRQANAIEARPYDARKLLSTIDVTLQDGRTITLGVLQREPDLILARMDERIEYRFLGEVGKRLLSPPGASRPEAVNK